MKYNLKDFLTPGKTFKGWLYRLGAIAFICLGTYLWCDVHHFETCCKKTTGIVLNTPKEQMTGRKSSRRKVWIVNYKFFVDGKYIEKTSRMSSPPNGRRITVYYNPNNLQDVRLETPSVFSAKAAIVIGLFTLILLWKE